MDLAFLTLCLLPVVALDCLLLLDLVFARRSGLFALVGDDMVWLRGRLLLRGETLAAVLHAALELELLRAVTRLNDAQQTANAETLATALEIDDVALLQRMLTLLCALGLLRWTSSAGVVLAQRNMTAALAPYADTEAQRVPILACLTGRRRGEQSALSQSGSEEADNGGPLLPSAPVLGARECERAAAVIVTRLRKWLARHRGINKSVCEIAPLSATSSTRDSDMPSVGQQVALSVMRSRRATKSGADAAAPKANVAHVVTSFELVALDPSPLSSVATSDAQRAESVLRQQLPDATVSVAVDDDAVVRHASNADIVLLTNVLMTHGKARLETLLRELRDSLRESTRVILIDYFDVDIRLPHASVSLARRLWGSKAQQY